MPNKVEPGMRFRKRETGEEFTAVSEWGGCSSINGERDWIVKEDVSHRSLASGVMYEPIPEPAPELCAWGLMCTGTREQHVRARLIDPSHHDFVAPQAKPVLREPKPRADGYPDVCLECRGDKGEWAYVCYSCYERLSADVFRALWIAWDALHRKPAAKDIPSADGGMGDQSRRLVDTEAARGGEAAFTKPRPPARFDLTLSERGPSAVAAAPAIEPWRPTVDDLHWIPDVVEGWRR